MPSSATTERPAVCDCGHVPAPVPPGGGATGYARTHDGRTLCYPCADAAQRAEIAAAEPGARHGGYLASDGRTVTTWTGGRLAYVWREWVTAEGFGGRTVRVWACDAAGGWWSGRGPGRGMYLRLYRLRANPLA